MHVFVCRSECANLWTHLWKEISDWYPLTTVWTFCQPLPSTFLIVLLPSSKALRQIFCAMYPCGLIVYQHVKIYKCFMADFTALNGHKWIIDKWRKLQKWWKDSPHVRGIESSGFIENVYIHFHGIVIHFWHLYQAVQIWKHSEGVCVLDNILWIVYIHRTINDLAYIQILMKYLP